MFGFSISQPTGTGSEHPAGNSHQVTEVGQDRIFTILAALVDTNILVYRFDNRFPQKQKIATEILRRGILENSIRVPHQAIVEFVSAVARPLRDHVMLPLIDAHLWSYAEHYGLSEIITEDFPA